MFTLQTNYRNVDYKITKLEKKWTGGGEDQIKHAAVKIR